MKALEDGGLFARSPSSETTQVRDKIPSVGNRPGVRWQGRKALRETLLATEAAWEHDCVAALPVDCGSSLPLLASGSLLPGVTVPCLIMFCRRKHPLSCRSKLRAHSGSELPQSTERKAFPPHSGR